MVIVVRKLVARLEGFLAHRSSDVIYAALIRQKIVGSLVRLSDAHQKNIEDSLGKKIFCDICMFSMG